LATVITAYLFQPSEGSACEQNPGHLDFSADLVLDNHRRTDVVSDDPVHPTKRGRAHRLIVGGVPRSAPLERPAGFIQLTRRAAG
jgi:hypothetical protein